MRIFRLIATPVILLGLLGFLAWGFMWGWRELTAPIPTTPPTPCVTVDTDIVTPSMVTVRVYNGGFTTGLARRIGTYLSDNGYQVDRVSDTEEQIRETIIRAHPRQNPEVRLVSSHFVGATVEMDDERVEGFVDVLVGTDFQGYATEGLLYQVSSNGGVICRPPQPTDESPAPTVEATDEAPADEAPADEAPADEAAVEQEETQE